MLIDLIAEARSNFMKIASTINPLINAKMQAVGTIGKTIVRGLPCLTLLDNTERPETITIGTDQSKLSPALARLMVGQWKKGAIPPKWDGKASERIVKELEQVVAGFRG